MIDLELPDIDLELPDIDLDALIAESAIDIDAAIRELNFDMASLDAEILTIELLDAT